MQVIESGERRGFPADPVHSARRCAELEAICRGILLRLPPEEQAFFREYRELLRSQEEANIRCAFYSGIRIGEKRQGK